MVIHFPHLIVQLRSCIRRNKQIIIIIINTHHYYFVLIVPSSLFSTAKVSFGTFLADRIPTCDRSFDLSNSAIYHHYYKRRAILFKIVGSRPMLIPDTLKPLLHLPLLHPLAIVPLGLTETFVTFITTDLEALLQVAFFHNIHYFSILSTRIDNSL